MNELGPGIYPGMNWNEYREIPYPSPSMMKHGLRSMLRLRRAMDGEIEVSAETTAIGNATHYLVMGELDRLAIMPEFEKDSENVTKNGKQSTSKSTAYYQESSANWRSENSDKTIVTSVQMNVAKKIHRRMMRRRKIRELIEDSEKEIVVIAEINGVMTKTRMDGLIESRFHAWDLKTCPDVEPGLFYRHCRKLGYYFQFAWHRLALRELNIELQKYEIIAAECGNDFDSGLIDVPMALLDVWETKVNRVLSQYKTSRDTGEWPGIYPMELGFLEVPNWDMGDVEDQVEWGA